MKTQLILIISLVLFLSCQTTPEVAQEVMEPPQLLNYDSLAYAQAMVLGTFHFNDDMLQPGKEEEINEVIGALSAFKPTKVVLELEPSMDERINRALGLYLKDSFDISQRSNEVFQLGFRMAKVYGHNRLWLFDDQTEYIGSLEGFSFENFSAHANESDSGYYNRYEEKIGEVFNHNQDLLEDLSLLEQLRLLNSSEAQRVNAQRMHAYEVRVGIQKSWMGPDWLGRYYQRNIRMMANVLKFSEPGDRILIIVGDNHKWTLDMLFDHTPDFDLVPSSNYLE